MPQNPGQPWAIIKRQLSGLMPAGPRSPGPAIARSAGREARLAGRLCDSRVAPESGVPGHWPRGPCRVGGERAGRYVPGGAKPVHRTWQGPASASAPAPLRPLRVARPGGARRGQLANFQEARPAQLSAHPSVCAASPKSTGINATQGRSGLRRRYLSSRSANKSDLSANVPSRRMSH